MHRYIQGRAWWSYYTNGNAICYESRNLKDHEISYATHDLELASIFHVLKMWKNYLMGNKFELKRDHNDLKNFFEHPTLNAIWTRWMEFLNECDFNIKHIKGKDNKVVDALNMRVYEMHVTTIIMYYSYLKRINFEVVDSYQH